MRVLVLGAAGMLGSAMFRGLNERRDWMVFGSLRSADDSRLFDPSIATRLLIGHNVDDDDALAALFAECRPDVVINCISLGKHLIQAGDPLRLIPTYALLPHRLAALCATVDARLIHVSTDGVFSGEKGNYSEDDPADARDLYGRSKLLGEPAGRHTVTIRCSMVGPELKRTDGLLEWFLRQREPCRCFTKAIFSGLPTITLAEIVRDVIIPNPALSGVYHVAAAPVSKHDLLKLIAEAYGVDTEIIPDGRVHIDRSLNAGRFAAATGYVAPEWRELVRRMHADHRSLEAPLRRAAE